MIISHLFNWLIRWLGWWTLLALVLLSIALGSVAYALAEVIRGLALGLLLPVTMVGLVLGWSLAAAKQLPGWLAGVIMFILGVEAIVVRVGRLGETIVAVIRSLVNLAWQAWLWPWQGRPDGTPSMLALIALWTDLSTLLTRLWDWGLGLVTGQPTFDPVATTLAWSLALGAGAAWAGWAVRRLNHPLLALAPIGALLATTLAYALDQVGTLLPILGATMLLMGLIGQYARERHWQSARIDFSASTRLDLTIVVVPITLALVVTAGSIPSISIWEIARFTQRLFQVEAMKDSLGMKRNPGRYAAPEQIRAPGLPRQHLLGSGPELSEEVALVINTGQPPLDPSDTGTDRVVPHYYWRSLTYDAYTGRGWRTGKTQPLAYQAGEPANPTTAPARRVLRQAVQVVGPQSGLLYAAGEVVTADHNYTIDWRGPGDSFAASIQATTYRVDSLVSTASEAELRSAGYDYPDWIGQRYLHLPRQIPERVLSLARDLTATAPTPYDRAKAIEAHLRTFPYSLDLPEPPVKRDMVDYFLFDLQQGYCDYYATTMVILARAAGLPARLAVGYASGTYDPAKAHYVVTEADAHSWVEIYFPDYGWIEFEPTAARQVFDRSAEAIPPDLSESLPALSDPATTLRDGAGQIGWLLLLGGGAFLVIGGLAWSAADGWRLRRLTPVVAVATLYQRLRRHGQRLAVPTWTGDTPYEFAASLAERVNTLAQEKRWGMVLAPAHQEVHRLTHLYVRASYSAHRLSPTEQTQAIQTWRCLRRRLWLVWLSVWWARVKDSGRR